MKRWVGGDSVLGFFEAIRYVMFRKEYGASYLLLLLLGVACIYLPYLLPLNTQALQMQVILLFLGGIAVAGTMLWSLFRSARQIRPTWTASRRSTQPKLFREIDEIAGALQRAGSL